MTTDVYLSPALVSRPTCETCPSACCRVGAGMILTNVEADFLRASGTELQQLPSEPARHRLLPLFVGKRQPFAPESQRYRLETDCGHIGRTASGDTFCAAYEDPNRPAPCGDLQQGDYSCHALRLQQGVTTQQEFDRFFDSTLDS